MHHARNAPTARMMNHVWAPIGLGRSTSRGRFLLGQRDQGPESAGGDQKLWRNCNA